MSGIHLQGDMKWHNFDATATTILQDSQAHRWPLQPSNPQRSRSRSPTRQLPHRPPRRLQRHQRAVVPAPCRACSRASTRAALWLRAAPRATSAPGQRWSCRKCKRGGHWRRRRCPSSSSRCTCGGSSRALPRRSQAQSLRQCNRCVLLLPPLHTSSSPPILLLFLLHIETLVLNPAL